MWTRSFRLGLLATVVLSFGAGCKEGLSAVPQEPAQRTVQNGLATAGAAKTIARIHWLGKKRLAAEPNAAAFMSIWNLPESAKLEGQTLDKLALAPWLETPKPEKLQTRNYSTLLASYPSAKLLRPLWEDLLREESFLEVRSATNRPGEAVLAIRLSEKRADLWETSLATVLKSFAGVQHLPPKEGAHGWRLQLAQHPPQSNPAANGLPRQLEFTRSGGWVLLSLTGSEPVLLKDLLNRIKKDHVPFVASPTNFWVDSDVDLQQVAGALGTGWKISPMWPRVAATMIGDGENVRTHAELSFPRALGIELDKWNIPTNMIHDPLIGFTAVRGLRPWLKSFKPWQDLQLGTPPNQAYFWAQTSVPWLHFLAMPSAEANPQVSKLSDYVINRIDPKLVAKKHYVGSFERRLEGPGVYWQGIPLFAPFFQVANFQRESFILAAFYPNRLTNAPAPSSLLAQVLSDSSLLGYDWEITGACLDGLTPIFQLVRRLFNQPRLPAETSIAWTRAVSAKLNNSATVAKLLANNKISIVRKSQIGLTAAELELMLDWIESPIFPRGLFSTSTPKIDD